MKMFQDYVYMLHFKGICLFQREQNELDACTYQGIKYILNVSTETQTYVSSFCLKKHYLI